eukprot:356375-Chlamydomonas_euryale.AAC.10
MHAVGLQSHHGGRDGGTQPASRRGRPRSSCSPGGSRVGDLLRGRDACAWRGGAAHGDKGRIPSAAMHDRPSQFIACVAITPQNSNFVLFCNMRVGDSSQDRFPKLLLLHVDNALGTAWRMQFVVLGCWRSDAWLVTFEWSDCEWCKIGAQHSTAGRPQPNDA